MSLYMSPATGEPPEILRYVTLLHERELNEDEQTVLDVHEEWLIANRTADTDWCRANMTADGVFCNTNGSRYLGAEHWCQLWDEYRAHIKGDRRTQGEPPLLISTDVDVTVEGDVAWVTGRNKFYGKFDGERLPEDARTTEIYRRVDGAWKMVHGHWSWGSPGGPAGGV
jgi:ketosteroid isomerase-like protein